jgi:hypothetical protein
MPVKYRGKAPANPVRQAPLLSLKKRPGKRKKLTRSLTRNPINALAQLLLKREILTPEQKKIAQVTVALTIAPVTVQVTAILVTTLTIALALNRGIALVTARAPVIQAVTQTLAQQRVPAIVREVIMKVSNPGTNRSV